MSPHTNKSFPPSRRMSSKKGYTVIAVVIVATMLTAVFLTEAVRVITMSTTSRAWDVEVNIDNTIRWSRQLWQEGIYQSLENSGSTQPRWNWWNNRFSDEMNRYFDQSWETNEWEDFQNSDGFGFFNIAGIGYSLTEQGWHSDRAFQGFGWDGTPDDPGGGDADASGLFHNFDEWPTAHSVSWAGNGFPADGAPDFNRMPEAAFDTSAGALSRRVERLAAGGGRLPMDGGHGWGAFVSEDMHSAGERWAVRTWIVRHHILYKPVTDFPLVVYGVSGDDGVSSQIAPGVRGWVVNQFEAGTLAVEDTLMLSALEGDVFALDHLRAGETEGMPYVYRHDVAMAWQLYDHIWGAHVGGLRAEAEAARAVFDVDAMISAWHLERAYTDHTDPDFLAAMALLEDRLPNPAMFAAVPPEDLIGRVVRETTDADGNPVTEVVNPGRAWEYYPDLLASIEIVDNWNPDFGIVEVRGGTGPNAGVMVRILDRGGQGAGPLAVPAGMLGVSHRHLLLTRGAVLGWDTTLGLFSPAGGDYLTMVYVQDGRIIWPRRPAADSPGFMGALFVSPTGSITGNPVFWGHLSVFSGSDVFAIDPTLGEAVFSPHFTAYPWDAAPAGVPWDAPFRTESLFENLSLLSPIQALVDTRVEMLN